MNFRRKPSRERGRMAVHRPRGISFVALREEVRALSDIVYVLREDFTARAPSLETSADRHGTASLPTSGFSSRVVTRLRPIERPEIH